VDVAKANELYELAERLAADTQQLRDSLRWEFLSQQLTDVITRDYDLGPVVRIEQIFGGYVNVSCAVWTKTDAGEHKYFVRKYNEDITEREVRFEHALVNHIVDKGFHVAARVYETKDGGTFVTREEQRGGATVTRFFAVYECLEGEDKYTWVKNRVTDKEYESAARVLAQFHHYAADFDPDELRREQPPIMEFVPTLAATFKACIAKATGTAFDTYLQAHFDNVLRVCDLGAGLAGGALDGLPVLPVHCDYHPGNQKWVDEQVVGLFDFDWSKIDYRAFDVGLAVSYFCSSWEGHDSGELWLDKAAIFVRAYQDEAAKFSSPGPMSSGELAVLPRMIANGNLFVINWDITAYYADPEPNVDEYLMYLKHQVMILEFIEAHLPELAALAEPGPAPTTTPTAGG
jgi:homoserine kinase type II